MNHLIYKLTAAFAFVSVFQMGFAYAHNEANVKVEIDGDLQFSPKYPTTHRIHFDSDTSAFKSIEGFYVVLPNNKQWLFREDGAIWYYDGASWSTKVP